MQSSIVKLFAALVAASSPALAVLSMTSPIATTTCTGGQVCSIAWKDDGTAPSLTQQGNCTIALYTGGAQQQTFLQPIVYPTTVDVATTQAVEFTVDPTVGPNGSDYFIRISSTSLNQNGTSTPEPYLSFSAKFTLAGMSGTFNSTVLGQISSAAGSSQTSTSHASSATNAATTTHSTTSSSHTTSATHTGAGFRDGANGALVAGAALFAGAIALF